MDCTSGVLATDGTILPPFLPPSSSLNFQMNLLC